jgi:regulatory protein
MAWPSASTNSDSHTSTDEASALASAMRFLSRRDHSEAEIRSKLFARRYTPAVVEAVIEKLLRFSYLDDRRTAFRFAESALTNGKGFGPRLRFDLMKRGYSSELIDAVMATLVPQFDETAAIRTIVSQKFSHLNLPDLCLKDRRRIVHYLQRRGFSLNSILHVLTDVE